MNLEISGGRPGYPCVVCKAPAEGAFKDYDEDLALPLRQNDDPLQQFNKIREPLFKIPHTQIIVPMLHYVLGFANELVAQLEVIADNPVLIDQLYTTLKVTKAQGYFNAFTGNHLRIIMANIRQLEQSLPQSLPLDKRAKAHQIANTLELLKDVQDLTESQFLSPDQMQELERRVEVLKQHMKTNMPLETVKQKGHFFFRHALDFTREWGNLAWFSEQGIESLHATYRRQAERYKMTDLRKQIFMLKWNFSNCILEASRPKPDDTEEYDFREEPEFFQDEGEDDEGDT
ncbi:hypothetical protein DdX_12435 [Ditylenchus destructor]|uniref:Uncharacterized protein n=1 Tax=Ditylenchus destructor TaxID=166010 RepID=A0AAD4R3E8_9BILA|nr:hypothetical protein DdX_12435 [Ditylenchus destructor]